ncbi:hypothetical protein T01_9217 [Trichinella spiralis]|uniref:Uncharacterized protein n=1 Tax=Trichinella spiralis TaxID=6334 RepID=A0A0V0YZR9_TRISP|nr:hypothetical protein T01_9217 [Trichinella spiralis]
MNPKLNSKGMGRENVQMRKATQINYNNTQDLHSRTPQ